jgi:hypothetical protein
MSATRLLSSDILWVSGFYDESEIEIRAARRGSAEKSSFPIVSLARSSDYSINLMAEQEKELKSIQSLF